MTAAATTDTKALIGLIDRLETLLNESELTELEIEAGETALVLRKPAALPATGAAPATMPAATPEVPANASQGAAADKGASQNAIVAPLTGLWYSSPSPGADSYVKVGNTVLAGQVIGLIEAMKLFSEIKSDRAGKVTRIYPEDGALVKAKEPLIEVEP